MQFSVEELELVYKALVKKSWSLSHAGIPKNDPRHAPYVELMRRVRPELNLVEAIACKCEATEHERHLSKIDAGYPAHTFSRRIRLIRKS